MKSVSCSDKSYCRCSSRNQDLGKPCGTAIDKLSGTSHLYSFLEWRSKKQAKTYLTFFCRKPTQRRDQFSQFLPQNCPHFIENGHFYLALRVNIPPFSEFLRQIDDHYFVLLVAIKVVFPDAGDIFTYQQNACACKEHE